MKANYVRRKWVHRCKKLIYEMELSVNNNNMRIKKIKPFQTYV